MASVRPAELGERVKVPVPNGPAFNVELTMEEVPPITSMPASKVPPLVKVLPDMLTVSTPDVFIAILLVPVIKLPEPESV